LAIRGIWHPGLGDAMDERVRVLPSDALIYTNTPRYSVQASVGVGIYF
jgi:hypothetical protein